MHSRSVTYPVYFCRCPFEVAVAVTWDVAAVEVVVEIRGAAEAEFDFAEELAESVAAVASAESVVAAVQAVLAGIAFVEAAMPSFLSYAYQVQVIEPVQWVLGQVARQLEELET